MRRSQEEAETQNQNERKVVNDKFDELAKGLAGSGSRREALKGFSLALAGVAVALLGLPNTAQAGSCLQDCQKRCWAAGLSKDYCHGYCHSFCNIRCC